MCWLQSNQRGGAGRRLRRQSGDQPGCSGAAAAAVRRCAAHGGSCSCEPLHGRWSDSRLAILLAPLSSSCLHGLTTISQQHSPRQSAADAARQTPCSQLTLFHMGKILAIHCHLPCASVHRRAGPHQRHAAAAQVGRDAAAEPAAGSGAATAALLCGGRAAPPQEECARLPARRPVSLFDPLATVPVICVPLAAAGSRFHTSCA